MNRCGRTALMLGSLVVLATLPGVARADGKTRELATGYGKESAACRRSADGIIKVRTGTQAVIAEGKTEYEAELATLTDGLGKVEEYCSELVATLAVLSADPNASYKSLEKALDERDNKIRKLRQQSKKTLEEVSPVIGKMIPIINARVGPAAVTPKTTPILFPSKRKIIAPVFAGTYEVVGSATTDTLSYSEDFHRKQTVVMVRATTLSCEDHHSVEEGASELAPSEAMKAVGVAWLRAYPRERKARRIREACMPSKTGSVIATIDDPIGLPQWPEFEPIAVAMLAAHK